MTASLSAGQAVRTSNPDLISGRSVARPQPEYKTSAADAKHRRDKERATVRLDTDQLRWVLDRGHHALSLVDGHHLCISGGGGKRHGRSGSENGPKRHILVHMISNEL